MCFTYLGFHPSRASVSFEGYDFPTNMKQLTSIVESGDADAANECPGACGAPHGADDVLRDIVIVGC